VTGSGKASDTLESKTTVRDEATSGERGEYTPVDVSELLERILERENMFRALRRVRKNKGGPGIDGMTVEQLPGYLKRHWPRIKTELFAGTYKPQPVKRVEIPKPGGGVRRLGVPTVTDRLIQQAIMQVLQAEIDPSFSHYSFGFRPNRSAHQAVALAQEYLNDGYSWTVDLDLEKFFDRVNHDVLMHRVKMRVDDKRVLRLINRFLKSGVSVDGTVERTREGTPQGGPLSPLLANILLDDLDKELERRGHRFVRYADDCNIYVKSRQAGDRVKASVTRFLERKLKLKVNEKKSAVARPWRSKILGFSFTGRRPNRRRVSEEAIKRFKHKTRGLTQRTRGKNIHQIITELGKYLRGWKAYYGFAEAVTSLKDLDKWLRRRLRCYHLKQWGSRGYKELRKRGVSRQLAWNTAKSAHNPWRLSRSPALSYALPTKYFRKLGLPCLVES
jgi:RNA-directed DNA polymerase